MESAAQLFLLQLAATPPTQLEGDQRQQLEAATCHGGLGLSLWEFASAPARKTEPRRLIVSGFVSIFEVMKAQLELLRSRDAPAVRGLLKELVEIFKTLTASSIIKLPFVARCNASPCAFCADFAS